MKSMIDIEIQLLPKRIFIKDDYLHTTVLPAISQNLSSNAKWSADVAKYYVNQATLLMLSLEPNITNPKRKAVLFDFTVAAQIIGNIDDRL